MARLTHPDITGHQADMEPDTGRTRTSPLEDVQLSGRRAAAVAGPDLMELAPSWPPRSC